MKTSGNRNRKTAQNAAPKLRRLPNGFSKKLCGLLLTECACELSGRQRADIHGALRSEDPSAYYRLDAAYGLQSMSEDRIGPTEGNPAVVRLLTAMLRKDPHLALKTPEERRAECLANVVKTDAELAAHSLSGLTCKKVVPRIKAILQAMLGACPDTEAIAYSAKHGPGTSIGCGFRHSSAYFKYANWPYAVSTGARPLLEQVIRLDERWYGSLEDSYRVRHCIPMWQVLPSNWMDSVFTITDHNRVTCVPKDGTKDRPIAIEPTGNVLLQLGLESILRAAFRQYSGIDLDTQANKNKAMAKAGSLDPSPMGYCTFDLSNASDTIRCDLVESLLPPAWFDLLYQLRSHQGVFPDGSVLLYSKMSSMGNGYTFVLESIVFYAIVRAVAEEYGCHDDYRRIAVFGDDLIFRRHLASPVRHYLEAFGFKVNMDKSFAAGILCESCGGDYRLGLNIRPVFVKTPESIADLICLRNQLNSWFLRHFSVRLPLSIDAFLLSFYDGELLLGPDSDTDYASYVHEDGFVRGHPYKIRALSTKASEVPGRDFMMRKLMHSLRSCQGEGNTFLVTERRADGRFSIVSRTVYAD